MDRDTGKLKVSNKLSGVIHKGKTKLSIPKEYNLAPREKFNNVDCEYEIEGGTVIRVFVDGKELPKDIEAEQRKLERIAQRKAEEEAECIRKEEEKKNAVLNRGFEKDSFDITKARAPKDTVDLGIQKYQAENFALKLKKFARFEENERDYSKSKFEFFKSGKREPEYQIVANYGATRFDNLTQRSLDSAKALLGDHCDEFTMSTNSRLITGLGGASVYETDITLHHVHGFPYLPASSIKGMVRSWIIQNVFGNPEKITEEGEKKNPLVNAEFRALTEDINFCKIFGCPKQATKIKLDNNGQRIKDEKGRDKTEKKDVILKDEKGKGQENQGKILFFDAFPTAAPEVVPEVMNPHYGPYYTDDGKTPPADYHNPVPIFFLAVDKKTKFQFILGSKYPNWLDWKIQEKTIIEWLKEALQNHGIGAKTAVGYGYMQ